MALFTYFFKITGLVPPSSNILSNPTMMGYNGNLSAFMSP